MTETTRTHVYLTVEDQRNIEKIRAAYPRLNKSGAMRHALEVAAILADGEARLVDSKGKPIRIVATG
jgi:hypothetical protein